MLWNNIGHFEKKRHNLEKGFENHHIHTTLAYAENK